MNMNILLKMVEPTYSKSNYTSINSSVRMDFHCELRLQLYKQLYVLSHK